LTFHEILCSPAGHVALADDRLRVWNAAVTHAYSFPPVAESPFLASPPVAA
jgi:hypothetical protein